MGGVAAQGRDIVSFAPGFPAPDTFPWPDFQEIAHELLSGRDGIGAAVRPDARLPPAARRDCRRHGAPRRADRARPPAHHDRLAAGPRSRRARAARSARRHPRRAADLHRRDLGVPQRRRPRWSASARKPTASTSPSSTTTYARLQREGRRATAALPRAELPEPDRPPDRTGQARARSSSGPSAATSCIVEDDPYRDLYFEDSATRGRRPADSRRRHGQAAWCT